MKGKLLSIFLLLNLIIFSGFAQNSLKGKITAALSEEKLIGASVFIPELKTGASADINGEYVIDNIPAGNYLIEVRYVSYRTIVKKVTVAGETIHDFVMTPAIAELSELVVTGVTHATELKQSPVIIKPIGAEELHGHASTNLVDALSSIPGISQITTGAAISKPTIRGLGYNRIVTLWNGIRQEGQQWGDEHGIEIDEYAIDRVEIIKGPGSLLYGSDAIAGVLNFLTPKPLPNGEVKTSLISNYQSNNHLVGYSLANEGNKNGFQWRGRFSNKFAGNYTNAYDGKVYNSGFKEFNGSLFLGLARNWGYSHLTFSSFNQKLGIVEGERNEEGRFIKIVPGINDNTIEEAVTKNDLRGYAIDFPYQDINHFRVVSNNQIMLGESALSIDVGFQKNLRKEFTDPVHPEEKELYMDLNTFNYSVKYNLPSRTGWESAVGIGGMVQQNINKGEEYLIPDYGAWDVGGFVFTQRTFQEKLTLAGGLRFDNRSISTEGLILDEEEGAEIKFESFDKFYNNISGSVGISYRPDKENTVKFNLSRGFRSPNIAEIGSNGKHEGTFRYEYGDKDMKPEISHQVDLAYFLNTDHVTLEATPFINLIQHYIFLKKLVGVSGNDSIPDPAEPETIAFQYTQGNAQLYGGEIFIDIHPHPLDWLHIENSISFVRAIQLDQPDSLTDLPFIPAPVYRGELKAKFNTVANWFSNAFVRFGLQHSFAQHHFLSAYNTETATPAYTLLNAGIGGNINLFPQKNKGKLSVFLSAENLANITYQSHLSRLKYAPINPVTGRQGVYNMGRNFSVKVILEL